MAGARACKSAAHLATLLVDERVVSMVWKMVAELVALKALPPAGYWAPWKALLWVDQTVLR